MASLDPATGRPLPDNAIQRILFVTKDVHVYQIPPLTSNKGFSASSWTAPPRPTAQHIFTARLRIIETSIDGKLKSDIVLEDPNNGDLFAAAPYTSTLVIQQALDSSRFFAIRVQGEGGMKATLGMGFEDRSPALDFNIALGEVKKVLGLSEGLTSTAQRPGNAVVKNKTDQNYKQDWSLKEGEKIQINVGSKGRRAGQDSISAGQRQDEGAALFSIAPPPPTVGKSETLIPSIAPPPRVVEDKSAAELGFDDGEFGEFQ